MLRGPIDGHLSRRHVAVPLQRPTRGLGGLRHHPLSGLAPGEVYRAVRVAANPVVSYTTLSPLPARPSTSSGTGWRSALCGTVSRIAPGGCYPPPCPTEPGRSSARDGEPPATRPSGRPIRVPESTRVARVRGFGIPHRSGFTRARHFPASAPLFDVADAGKWRAAVTQAFPAVSAMRTSSGKSRGKSPKSRCPAASADCCTAAATSGASAAGVCTMTSSCRKKARCGEWAEATARRVHGAEHGDLGLGARRQGAGLDNAGVEIAPAPARGSRGAFIARHRGEHPRLELSHVDHEHPSRICAYRVAQHARQLECSPVRRRRAVLRGARSHPDHASDGCVNERSPPRCWPAPSSVGCTAGT